MVQMEKIVSLCKRRGFIFQSSEIYGGTGSCWDYGPLGVELKKNIKDIWWRDIVRRRTDIVGLDSSILMHPKVWEASGHVAGFHDPLVDCKSCKGRFKASDLEKEVCPLCGGELTPPRKFNLMFKTFMGPLEEEASITYLRPETAQGIFVNFLNVLQTTRKKLPFGIAQIGKSFRNEITPGNFIFRTREFEQMEIEYFVKPGTDEQWHRYWIQERLQWYIDYGIRKENLRLREHTKDELAHYAKSCVDIEYNFPMGWSELEGIANRTDFDLRQHSSYSGESLLYFDEETNQHIFPYVIEPSGGIDRTLLAFILDAYAEEIVRGEKRVLLRLHPELAPVKIAVLPLLRNREDIVSCAKKIHEMLCRDYTCMYDQTASIGRLYRRQDEIGTPFCITVDVQSVQEDQKVTIRERDSMVQIRVPIDELPQAFELIFKKGWQEALSIYPLHDKDLKSQTE
jgi:glycyl-tRNA synthetase